MSDDKGAIEATGTRRQSRRALSLAIIIAGALLLASVPMTLVVLSFAGTRTLDLPGVAVILSAVVGMALVVAGFAVQD